MAHDDDGVTGIAAAAYGVIEMGLTRQVQRRIRFIQQQHGCALRQDTGQMHACTLTAGQ